MSDPANELPNELPSLPNLADELASLRAAADFLEENQMSQCQLLRNAVKVLEFIRSGGTVAIDRLPNNQFEISKGLCQIYWAPDVLNLGVLAKKVDEIERVYSQGGMMQVGGRVPDRHRGRETYVMQGDWHHSDVNRTSQHEVTGEWSPDQVARLWPE